jgi:hypothetical protein
MKTVAQKNDLPPESYVVEIGGKIRSAHGIFVEALKAAFALKRKFPHSQIKVHNTEHSRIEN